MIIVGYPGIGKTSAADFNENCIDLDSTSFEIDGCYPANWETIYINIAKSLSDQRYIVFVNSSECVRKELIRRNIEDVAVCVPSLHLESEWTKKLLDRYNKSKKEEDFRAYASAETCYSYYIKSMLEDAQKAGWSSIVLEDMKYNLLSEIMIQK